MDIEVFIECSGYAALYKLIRASNGELIWSKNSWTGNTEKMKKKFIKSPVPPTIQLDVELFHDERIVYMPDFIPYDESHLEQLYEH